MPKIRFSDVGTAAGCAGIVAMFGLYLIIYGGIAVGIVLGVIWLWRHI